MNKDGFDLIVEQLNLVINLLKQGRSYGVRVVISKEFEKRLLIEKPSGYESIIKNVIIE